MLQLIHSKTFILHSIEFLLFSLPLFWQSLHESVDIDRYIDIIDKMKCASFSRTLNPSAQSKINDRALEIAV